MKNLRIIYLLLFLLIFGVAFYVPKVSAVGLAGLCDSQDDCDEGLYCKISEDPAYCATELAEGATCSYSYQCADNLNCESGSGSETICLASGSSNGGTDNIDSRVAATLDNPLGDPEMRIPVVIGRVIQVLLGVLGSLALFVFCFGAFHWITSAGYPQRVEAGTKTMLFAVAGMFVIFAAYGILKALLRVLEVSPG